MGGALLHGGATVPQTHRVVRGTRGDALAVPGEADARGVAVGGLGVAAQEGRVH